MKTTVNVEFTNDDLAEFASKVLVKVLGAVGQDIGSAFANPQAVAIVQNLFSNLAGMQQRQRPRATVGAPLGVPHVYYQQGPYGPQPGTGPSPFMQGIAHGVQAAMHGMGIADAGTPPPQNVQPIREPAHVERCFPVEATRQMEAGIVCCQCATPNGAQRTHCRYCGHPLCHEPIGKPIVTPPPEVPPEPEAS